jgi:hypothetical protein
MSEDNEHEENAPKKKISLGKILGRLVKLSLILGVFLFIGLTILANIGGNSPVLHEAIEEVLSQKTGYKAKIHTFNRMSFFPDINIDIEHVEFRKMISTTQETGEMLTEAYGEPVMLVEKANIALGFFDMVLGNSKLKVIDIRNLQSAPGALMAKSLHLESIVLEEIGDHGGALNIKGAIDDKPLTLSMGFDVSGRPGNRKYDVSGERHLRANIDGVSVEARLNDYALSGGVQLSDLKVVTGGVNTLNGQVDIKYNPEQHIEVSGELVLYPSKSIINPDLKITPAPDMLSVKGKISSDVFNINDVKAGSPVSKAVNKISALMNGGSSKGISLEGLDVDVKLKVKAFHAGDLKLGALNVPLRIKDKVLKIEPLSGKISKGELAGAIIFDASSRVATLSQKMTIKALDYGDLQRQFMKDAEISGQADIALNINAKADTIDGLFEDAKGDFTFVTGEGKMKSNILNLWGGGLLNTMLPKLGENKDLNLNCAVIDLNIENKTLKTNALFVDTHKITMVGEGQYKMDTDRLDMKLSPKTKDVALLDVATAVHVKGPLSDVSVTPSALDIGKKVGGLLLGAVNPAFYAVTLVDLGLNEDHPCKQYLIEKEELVPPAEDTTPEVKEESTNQ